MLPEKKLSCPVVGRWALGRAALSLLVFFFWCCSCQKCPFKSICGWIHNWNWLGCKTDWRRPLIRPALKFVEVKWIAIRNELCSNFICFHFYRLGSSLWIFIFFHFYLFFQILHDMVNKQFDHPGSPLWTTWSARFTLVNNLITQVHPCVEPLAGARLCGRLLDHRTHPCFKHCLVVTK